MCVIFIFDKNARSDLTYVNYVVQVLFGDSLMRAFLAQLRLRIFYFIKREVQIHKLSFISHASTVRQIIQYIQKAAERHAPL